MIGVGRAARVVGTASVVDQKRDQTTTPVAGWASVSKYDSIVSEGASVSSITHYWTRFLQDTYGTFDIYVTLSAPATGRERLRWEIAGDPTTGFVTFDESRVNSAGNLEMAFIKGRTQHRIRVSVTEREKWFRPRRFVLNLLSADNCEVADGPNTLVLIVYSRKEPPQIAITGGGTMTGSPNATANVTFTLKDPDGTDYDMSKLIDQVDVYYRIYLSTDAYKTPVPTKIGATSGGSSFGTDPRQQRVTWTSSSSATQVVTLTEVSAPSGTYKLEALVERPTVKYDSEWINPDTGIKSTGTIDIHVDENQWMFSNDYPLLRQDNYGLYIQDGWHPGYPTGYGYGGQQQATTSLPHVEFHSQTAASPVEDPITGNDMDWWTNTPQVTNGPSYTRQLFSVQYCGGPWIGHIPPAGTHYIRSAYRIEPYKTADVDHQAQIISVGYRARQVARSSSVQFRMRNVAPTSGYSTFGDQTTATTTFEIDSTLYVNLSGSTVDLKLVDGTSNVLTYGSGADIELGSSALDTANNLKNAINAIASGTKFLALRQGTVVTVRRLESAPSKGTGGADSADQVISYTGYSSGYAQQPARWRSTSIVDASGNDVRDYGGATGEYYYDEETGTEIWFWSMKNMWGRNAGWTGGAGLTLTSAPERLSASPAPPWNKWYGVYRDPIWGLTVWMVNYVSDEPAGFDPTVIPPGSDVYRYNQGLSSPNVRAFTAWSNSTHPPSRTAVVGDAPGWLIESSETGYLPDNATWTQVSAKGYDFTEYSKNLMVFNPVWVSSYDGSDDVQGFASIRDNDKGTLIHSIQMQMFDDQGDFYDSTTGSWPDFFPAQLYNWWSPRGNCTSTDDNRPSVDLVVT